MIDFDGEWIWLRVQGEGSDSVFFFPRSQTHVFAPLDEMFAFVRETVEGPLRVRGVAFDVDSVYVMPWDALTRDEKIQFGPGVVQVSATPPQQSGRRWVSPEVYAQFQKSVDGDWTIGLGVDPSTFTRTADGGLHTARAFSYDADLVVHLLKREFDQLKPDPLQVLSEAEV